MNVLDNQVELLFLDHDHLPARTLRVDRRTMYVTGAVVAAIGEPRAA